MLKNPTYAGRVYGLRHKAVQPGKRVAQTYGKTSMVDLPFEEWVPLKVVVESPIVTWAEYQATQDRLKANQRFSPRNAKHQYLLRGLIVCEAHGRTYHGRYHAKDKFVYVCSAYRPGHTHLEPCKRYLYGLTLDRAVWEKASDVLSNPEVILNELERRQKTQVSTEDAIRESLQRLGRRMEANLQAEVKLLGLYVRGEVSEEVFPRTQANLKAEKTWCHEERDRLETQLRDMRRKAVSHEQLRALSEQLTDKLSSADFNDRRFVLESLDTRIHVSPKGSIRLTFAIPADTSIALTSPGICPPLPGR